MNTRLSWHNGFSLVEMTVVLLLITLLASVAVRETSELGFQTRYEVTKDRLEMIKQAILGNPRQITNGQQAISGFVADMGRLPDNMRELLQMGYCVKKIASDPPSAGDLHATAIRPNACSDTDYEWRWTNLPCTNGIAACTGGHRWMAKQLDSTTGLSFGWNGPYMTVNGSPEDPDVLTDGWGRLAEADDPLTIPYDEFTYYGWRFERGLNSAMLGDANTANDQNDPDGFVRLVIQSLGKDQAISNGLPNLNGDYDDDYPPNFQQNDAGVYYPNPLIDKEDWLVDVSGGITTHFKATVSPVCGFNGSLSATINAMPSTENRLRICRNASGRWEESGCYVSKQTCASIDAKDSATTSADKITIWNAQTNHCEIAKDDCSGAGFTWDTTSSSCHINKTACEALTNPGIWTGASSCHLEPLECLALAGNWKADTGICEFDATSCASANGSWDASTSSCDFKPSSTNPEKCDTSVANDSGTWGCNISQTNCNVAGGAWNRCDFNPVQCLNMAGGSYVSRCEFTASMCARSGGVWQPNSASCQFNATSCGYLGGAWDAVNSYCAFDSMSCSNIGANWNSFCAIDTQINCEAAYGNWNANTAQCEFNDTQCLRKGGKPREGDCAMPRAEHDGAPFNKQTCETATGVWNAHRKAICLNVFYRKYGVLKWTTSLPTLVDEDGSLQSVQFDFLRNNQAFCTAYNGAWDGVQCLYNIPAGQNAIGIYEYTDNDNDGIYCEPGSDYLYPSDRQSPIAVDFRPKTTLPVINW